METRPQEYISKNSGASVSAIQYTEKSGPAGLVKKGKPVEINGVQTGRSAPQDSVFMPYLNGDLGFEPIRLGEWFVVNATGDCFVMPDADFQREYGPEPPKNPVNEHYEQYREQTKRYARIAQESLARVVSPQKGDTFEVTDTHLATALENLVFAVQGSAKSLAVARLLVQEKKK